MSGAEQRYERLRLDDLSDADVGTWKAMVDGSSAVVSPFLSHGYAAACAAAGFGVEVVVARKGNVASGFLPFQKRDGGFGLIGLGVRAGGGMTDYFQPIVAGAVGETDWYGFFQATGCRLLDLSHASDHDPVPGENRAPADGSPRTVLNEGFEAWWQSWSEVNSSRAKDLERRGRKLARDFGPVQFELEADPSDMLLDRIIDMKRLQYGNRQTADVFADPRHARLLHCLKANKDPQARLVFTTLHAGDILAAAHVGLAQGEILHYWFPVYDETTSKTSPGRLMILDMLRNLDAGGFRVLDYGAGESRTKLEFANDLVPLITGTWQRPGPGGWVARAAQSLLWRI